MRKGFFKKTLATVLCFCMAAAVLAGCGGKSSDSKEVTKNDVAGIAGYKAFKNQVTIDIPVYDRGKEGVPDVSNNYWTKWINENFGKTYNVQVNFVPITRSDVLTSYSLLAAAGKLPTILMEYDYPKQAQWAEDGYLAEYDLDVFANIAPTYYKRMVDLDQIKFTKMNGKTYFALAERPYSNSGYTFVTWYREDWVKAVGYDKWPTTWAEQKDCLQKIVDKGLCAHPLGGSMVTGAGVDQNYAYRTYPQNELDWAMYGDYNVPALSSAANKALLKRVNEQYNLGFIDPEYYLTSSTDAAANFVNGKSMFYSAYIAANMPDLTAFYENNPDGKLAVQVCTGLETDAEGGTTNAFRPDNPFGMMVSFSSQASGDQIKAAMMYMEWLTQPENLFTFQWGFEGEHYTKGADGLPVSVADYSGDKTQGFNNSKDYWCVTIEARNAGTIEQIIAQNSPKGLPQDFTQQIIDNYYGKVKVWQAGYANNDCMFATSISAEATYAQTLYSLYTEYRDKLTMCKPGEFDALYTDLSSKYLSQGYQAIIDERKAAYDKGLCTKLK